MGDEGFQPLLFGDIVPVTYAFLRSDYFEEGVPFRQSDWYIYCKLPFLGCSFATWLMRLISIGIRPPKCVFGVFTLLHLWVCSNGRSTVQYKDVGWAHIPSWLHQL